MQFAHTGNDGLGGFGIRANPEGRIFFSQFAQGNAHLFLVGFGFRFNSNRDYRIREYHGFQDNRCFFIAQGIAGAGILQAYSCCNITSENFFNFRTVIGVHTQDTADSFSLVFIGVIYIGAGGQGTGVHSEECQTAYIRVSCNLEGQSSERFRVAGRSFFFFARFRVGAFDGRNIQRRRHVINDGIQQGLYAFVLVGRTAGYRIQFALAGHLTDGAFDFFFRQVFTFQIFFHQVIVAFSNSFQQDLTVLLGGFNIGFRNGFEFFFLAQLVSVNNCLHLYQVDQTFESIFSTDRYLNCNCICTQAIFHHLNNIEEISAGGIHLIYISDTGYIVFFRLTPNRFGLGFNAAFGAEYGHGTIQYTQGTFNFYGEVNVPRGVDDVNGMAFPMTGRSCGSNRNTTFLFLNHPVHGGSAIVNFTDLVSLAGVEQDTFRGSSFTSIDVSHDADVSDFI